MPLVDHLPACNRLSRAPQAALVADTGVLVSVPMISSDAAGAEGWLAVDYTDRLRPVATNDARFAEDCLCGAGVDSELDPKTWSWCGWQR